MFFIVFSSMSSASVSRCRHGQFKTSVSRCQYNFKKFFRGISGGVKPARNLMTGGGSQRNNQQTGRKTGRKTAAGRQENRIRMTGRKRESEDRRRKIRRKKARKKSRRAFNIIARTLDHITRSRRNLRLKFLSCLHIESQ